MTLPVPATTTPYYYKWNDLRTYWKKKLNDYKKSIEENGNK